jgi:mannose-6-phosphate isomerase-like protein (cupin superfamily)
MSGSVCGAALLMPLLMATNGMGAAKGAPAWKGFRIEELSSKRAKSGRAYLEFLRVPEMNAGIYELAAGSEDLQSPHTEDEIYYVVAGTARFRAAGEVTDVGPGSVLYVRSGVSHRFEEITSDLKILVVFASASGD